MSAYIVRPNTPNWQLISNAIMSPYRIGVEWGFGKIYECCPLITSSQHMKLQLSPVSKYFIVECLLSNIHTCLKIIHSYQFQHFLH